MKQTLVIGQLNLLKFINYILRSVYSNRITFSPKWWHIFMICCCAKIIRLAAIHANSVYLDHKLYVFSEHSETMFFFLKTGWKYNDYNTIYIWMIKYTKPQPWYECCDVLIVFPLHPGINHLQNCHQDRADVFDWRDFFIESWKTNGKDVIARSSVTSTHQNW
jgi:hypothetical protein